MINFFRKNLIDISIFILLQYFFTSFILMYLYSGGNPINHDAAGYVLNLNYLSDLGRTHYFNGSKNAFWLFYNFSLGLVGVGTILYFYVTAALLKRSLIKQIIIILGILSGLGYMLIGYFPVDIYLSQHISSGMLAFYSFFLAELLLVIFVNKKSYHMIYFLTLFLILLFAGRILLVYLIKNSGLEADKLLNIKTVSQKILVYGQIIVAIMILINLKKRTLYV